ncbi:hypothetical protein F1737_09030 [Methanoplanus sp. FWC-SCC4]|uniref:Uncharacterized protein n=1 Tax=Methanochimaera problematica TaxID=2609417 RepID=A0AA97FD20_9EURY|nr:hypothetical protein [Methanoplanus sp. FWC-SCC4]WOF16822.1 hypothetical protein F1737_09030 [Methanoplanus sp. FWC-SCC4]
MNFKILSVLFLLLLIIVAPVSAKDEIWFFNTDDFTATATDTMMIQSIRAENLHEGTIQRFVFDSYGEAYNLEIKSYPKDWGWWNFDAICTYPDGSTQTQHLEKFAPISFDYDINIQSYWLYGELAWETNIYVTLSPLSIENYRQIPIDDTTYPEGYPAVRYQPLAFSYIQGISNDIFEKVTVYYVNAEEFEKIKSGDITLPFIEGVGDLFAWTWEMVLGGISKIPYVGQFFVTVLQIAAIFIEEAIFWINLLFIQNWALFIMTMEFFVIGEAIYSTRNFMKLLTRFVDNNVKIFKFFTWLATLAIDLVLKFVDAVAKIIQALKPI